MSSWDVSHNLSPIEKAVPNANRPLRPRSDREGANRGGIDPLAAISPIRASLNTPKPDPGEEYPHINTDLFGSYDPKNRFMPLARMVAPYNAPDYPRQQPTMDGYVMDYISAFTAEMGRQLTYGLLPDHDGIHAGADAGHLDAGSRLRRLRPFVLRGAVADLHKPLLLSCGDSLRIRHQPSSCGRVSGPQHCGNAFRTSGVESPHMARLLRFAEPCVVHENHPRVEILR